MIAVLPNIGIKVVPSRVDIRQEITTIISEMSLPAGVKVFIDGDTIKVSSHASQLGTTFIQPLNSKLLNSIEQHISNELVRRIFFTTV